MSKIAEKKAWERYPIVKPPYSTITDATANVKHAFNREGYIKGYDQAMQDFLEKAEKILTERMYFSDDEAKQFKNYIENESEE